MFTKTDIRKWCLIDYSIKLNRYTFILLEQFMRKPQPCNYGIRETGR